MAEIALPAEGEPVPPRVRRYWLRRLAKELFALFVALLLLLAAGLVLLDTAPGHRFAACS
jgi:translocation and assembly module TamB